MLINFTHEILLRMSFELLILSIFKANESVQENPNTNTNLSLKT